jgi:hypothetical protein
MGQPLSSVARERLRRSMVQVVLAVGLGALLVAESSRYLQGGDSPEFALIYEEGGVPHPPGFPAFVLWLRAMHAILTTLGVPHHPAHAAAVATALLAVPASLFFYSAARAWGAAPRPAMYATIAALTWNRAFIEFTHPEIWAMMATVAMGILWAAAPALPASTHGPRAARRVLWLGALGGIGIATHTTLVFLAPLGLLGVVTGISEAKGARARAAIVGAFAFVVGLSPYVMLMFTARHPDGRWVWNDPSTPGRLWLHALRDDYGTFSLSPFQGKSYGAENVFAWLEASIFDGTFFCVLVSIAIAVWVIGQRRPESVRQFFALPGSKAWVALVACWLISGPIFLSMFNTNPEGIGAQSVSHTYLLPATLVFLAVAVAASAEWARAPRAAAAVAALVVAVIAWRGHRAAAAYDTSVTEDYLVDTANALPPHAVVFVWNDTRSFGFMWLSKAMHARPDVDFVSLALLQRDFYRVPVENALGRPFPKSKSGFYDLVGMVKSLAASGRPVLFATDDMLFYPQVARALPTYPLGTALRVLPRGERPPSAAELEAENDRLFATFRAKQHGEGVTPDTWAADLYRCYSRTWLMLADRFDQEKDPAGSARAEARGRAWELPAPAP